MTPEEEDAERIHLRLLAVVRCGMKLWDDATDAPLSPGWTVVRKDNMLAFIAALQAVEEERLAGIGRRKEREREERRKRGILAAPPDAEMLGHELVEISRTSVVLTHKPTPGPDRRAEQMLALHRHGLTYKKIGTLFGVGGERIRQGCNRAIRSERHPSRRWRPDAVEIARTEAHTIRGAGQGAEGWDDRLAAILKLLSDPPARKVKAA